MAITRSQLLLSAVFLAAGTVLGQDCGTGVYDSEIRQCQQLYTEGGICGDDEFLVGKDSNGAPQCYECPAGMNFINYKGNASSHCDCKFAFIHVETNGVVDRSVCHAAFTRGPCPQGQLLIPTSIKDVGRCQVTPCPNDKLSVLPVNPETYEVELATPGHAQASCVGLGEAFGHISCDVLDLKRQMVIGGPSYTLECGAKILSSAVNIPQRSCRSNMKRNSAGKCRRVLS